jgi:TonB family protein
MTPEKAYLQTERVLFLEGKVDSALSLYDFIIQEFPSSRYAGKSAFAKAWIVEYYANPGDSTVILAYQSVIDQYPETEYAEEAKIRLGLSQRIQSTVPVAREATSSEEEKDSTTLAAAPDTSGPEFPMAPNPFRRGEFVYPESEIWTDIEGAVLLKIKIDFDGKVTEAEVVSSLDNIWIDEAARQAALNTTFETDKFEMVQLGGYFLYSVEVKPPNLDPHTDPTQPNPNPFDEP